jgi:hypothetical protein
MEVANNTYALYTILAGMAREQSDLYIYNFFKNNHKGFVQSNQKAIG